MCTKNEAFEILASVYASCNQISDGKIHDAILYGSYARGEQNAESDIDILLTADLTQEQIVEKRRSTTSRFPFRSFRWRSSDAMQTSFRSIKTF